MPSAVKARLRWPRDNTARGDPALGLQPHGDIGGGGGVERHFLGEGGLVDAGLVLQHTHHGVLHRCYLPSEVLVKAGDCDLVRTPDQVAGLVIQVDRDEMRSGLRHGTGEKVKNRELASSISTESSKG